MKKEYTTPQMCVHVIALADIITISQEDPWLLLPADWVSNKQ